MTTQTHPMYPGDPSENPASRHTAPQLNVLLSDALELQASQLHLRLSVMFDNAGERLAELLDTPEAGYQRSAVADDESDKGNEPLKKLIATVRSERGSIEAAFLSAVNENNRTGQSHREEQVSAGTLSLIDPDEMDEMVALGAMYTAGMNQFGEEVDSLAARLEHLQNTADRPLPVHIFDLRHICEAFQIALKQVDLPIDQKLLLYKIFDQDVSSCLGDMYTSLNRLFIEAGVLPEVVYTVKNEASKTPQSGQGARADSGNPGSVDTAAEQTGDHDNGDDHSNDDTTGIQTAISRFFNQFMTGFAIANGKEIPQSFTATPSEAESSNSYSHDDIVGSLSKLQTRMVDVNLDELPKLDIEHIKRSILADLGSSNGGAITRFLNTHHQRHIDFVGMIFEEIAEDESISPIITNLLMLLQIPMIKTAMIDEALFTDNAHPARITLDLITKAGRGIAEATESLFVELKTIVSGVLHNNAVDKSTFESAVKQLQALIEREEAIAAENEKNMQHDIIRQHARDIVLEEMRRISINRTIPEDNRPLMLKYWPSLMFNHYLKHGMDSDEWLFSLETFGALMESLQPVSTRSQWYSLRDNHESLSEAVKDALYETHKNREEIDAQIAALNHTFAAMLDTRPDQLADEPEVEESSPASAADPLEHSDHEPMAPEKPVDIKHDDKAARIGKQVKTAQEKLSRLPSNLHPGVWFEVFEDEHKPVRRLKLSAILTDTAKLLFVDRQGIKVMEKDTDDFLAELENEQSRFIADHSTFERALGAVIHKFAD